MATRFVPSEGVLALFYPVFNSTTVVDRNHLVRFEIRVGHNKTDTREEPTNMPFDLTDNPSGLIPFLRLVMKLDHPNLYAALWGTTGGPLQVQSYATLEAAVAGNPNEVGDATAFTKFIQVWPGKGCIPQEPKLLEPKPAALNKRRDKSQDAIG
jgi:hypothetical protein